MKKPLYNWSAFISTTGLMLLISIALAGMRNPDLPVNYVPEKLTKKKAKPIEVELFAKAGGSGGQSSSKPSKNNQARKKQAPRRVRTTPPPRFSVPPISKPLNEIKKAFILPAGKKFTAVEKPLNIKVPVRNDLITLEDPVITEIENNSTPTEEHSEDSGSQVAGPAGGGTGFGGNSNSYSNSIGNGSDTEQLKFGLGEGRQPPPRYPRMAERRGQEGSVTLEFDIDKNGYPKNVNVKSASAWPLLNKEAKRVISSRWKFAAGNERHCQITIEFRLRK
ncbi:MAG: energy transducer TonB [Lentisphaeraceae bacterium]|nr:energy transducer TonB [Lentisphaeraceae bacterium]